MREASERRPKKNMRSSCDECTMWWNWPAVHGVWKSAMAARAWMSIEGVCTSTYSSACDLDVCWKK